MGKEERARVWERKRKKTYKQTITAFSSKAKVLTQTVSISINVSSSELREEDEKNGRGGKYIQVEATQS
jgi:hypothetical protein